MTTYKPGDIVWAIMPFVEGDRQKQRPVAVLLDSGDQDVTVVRITSRSPRDQYDVAIKDLKAAGLPVASTIRVGKAYTLPRAEIGRRTGKLSAQDRAAVRVILQKLTDGWK